MAYGSFLSRKSFIEKVAIGFQRLCETVMSDELHKESRARSKAGEWGSERAGK
jgi:hypothetical protein